MILWWTYGLTCAVAAILLPYNEPKWAAMILLVLWVISSHDDNYPRKP